MIFLLLLLLFLRSPRIANKNMEARHSSGCAAGKAAYRLQTATPFPVPRHPPEKRLLSMHACVYTNKPMDI